MSYIYIYTCRLVPLDSSFHALFVAGHAADVSQCSMVKKGTHTAAVYTSNQRVNRWSVAFVIGQSVWCRAAWVSFSQVGQQLGSEACMTWIQDRDLVHTCFDWKTWQASC